MGNKKQPSSIDKLPPEVRDEVNRARQQFGWTIDQLVAYCSEEGHHVTRSAMGRHVRSLHLDVEAAAEKMNRAQSISTALVERFGDKPDNELARLNIQMLHGQVFDAILAEDDLVDEEGNPLPIDSLKLVRLTKSIQQLLSAEKMNAERVAQIRREARAEATKEAAENATKEARAKGLSKDTVEAIRIAVLGSDA